VVLKALRRLAALIACNGGLFGPSVAAGNPIPGLTQGSVLFAGAGGALSQDNANLSWDNAAKQLLVGANNGVKLTNQVSGAAAAAGTLANAPAAGNPAFWLPVTINGTNRFVPAW
jgi:hypothetical protein